MCSARPSLKKKSHYNSYYLQQWCPEQYCQVECQHTLSYQFWYFADLFVCACKVQTALAHLREEAIDL